MAWKIGSSRPAEELMTRNTSAVAFSRSSAPSRSRRRRADSLSARTVVALRRFGIALRLRALVGLLLALERRRIAHPKGLGLRRFSKLDYSRDLRPGKGGWGMVCNRRNPPMSALGHKRTLGHVQSMSALPPKADIGTGPYQLRRSNSGSLAMPAAIRRAALRVNNLARDRRPMPSPE